MQSGVPTLGRIFVALALLLPPACLPARAASAFASSPRRVNAPYFVGDVPFGKTAVFWFGRVTPQQNYADVRVGYNDSELYVNVAVFDRRLWYDTTPSLAELTAWDAPSLFLDLDGNTGDAPDANAYRFVAQLNWWEARGAWQGAYRGNNSNWVTATVPFTTTTGWRGDAPLNDVDDRGWVVTYRIPFAGLGLGGAPPQGTIWGLGVILHDRDDASGTFIPDQVWPETMNPASPATWGQLAFGLPTYTAPLATPGSMVTIRHGLNGAVVPDVSAGGDTVCGDGLDYWTEWGEANYAGAGHANVQNQADVAELMVEGKVHFLETRTTRPDDKPLVLKGDRVHLLDPAQPYAAATVVGNPAQFQARGLALAGPNINLNRGTDRVWTEGPGRLEIVLDRDFSGQSIPGGLPVTVRWRERMTLEGDTLRFEGAVHVTSRLDELHTDTLEIGFKEPIPLGDPEKQSRPEVRRLRCRGGVVLESQSADAQGPIAWQRVEVADLALDLTTGAATAGGPGQLRTVRRGSAAPLLNRLGPRQPPADAAAVGKPSPHSVPDLPLRDSSSLSYLEVRFQRGAAGNLQQRRLTCEGQVVAIFGPIGAWEERLSADRPESLGPRGAVLRCDQLGVAQMPVPGTNYLTLELEAQGNTLVEGQHYTARAHRLTYAEAKDLLILEGDGRSDAQLFRQMYPGGPLSATTARRIQYWPSLRKGSVDGPRFLEHQTSPAPGS